MEHCSGPDAALAGIVKDGSISALTHIGDATSTHVEAVSVVRVGVQAIGFAVAEARSWSMGGGGGGGGWTGGGAGTRFGGGGGGQWGQLCMTGVRNACH